MVHLGSTAGAGHLIILGAEGADPPAAEPVGDRSQAAQHGRHHLAPQSLQHQVGLISLNAGRGVSCSLNAHEEAPCTHHPRAQTAMASRAMRIRMRNYGRCTAT